MEKWHYTSSFMRHVSVAVEGGRRAVEVEMGDGMYVRGWMGKDIGRRRRNSTAHVQVARRAARVAAGGHWIA
jgi:hypothetical protein